MIALKKAAVGATLKTRLQNQNYLSHRRLSTKKFSPTRKIPRRPANRVKFTGQAELRRTV